MAQYLDYEGLKKYHGLIKGYIDENISGITSFEYVIVGAGSLPETGEKGKIYLKDSATNSGNQYYDEYIWIVETGSATGRYEFIGTTAMNLDGYLTKEDAARDYAKKSEIPTDTNTTYTFANGTNGFTVTPSGGSAQPVTVTPNITVRCGDIITPTWSEGNEESSSIGFDSSYFELGKTAAGVVTITSKISVSAIPLADITITKLEETTT